MLPVRLTRAAASSKTLALGLWGFLTWWSECPEQRNYFAAHALRVNVPNDGWCSGVLAHLAPFGQVLVIAQCANAMIYAASTVAARVDQFLRRTLSLVDQVGD